MSDPLQIAYLARARSALELAAGSTGPTVEQKAAAFREVAFAVLKAGQDGNPVALLSSSHNPVTQQFTKSASAFVLADLGDAAAAALSEAFVASVAESSLLDAIAKYARVIPPNFSHALLASGFSADVVREGDPRVVRRFNLGAVEVEPTKSVAIVVLSKELANAAGTAGLRAFEAELTSSIARACNAAVLGQLIDSSTIDIAGSGDPLADLRAGLAAAGPSSGFVVAVPAGAAADLATRAENRGAGVRGGTFAPGIELVAVDDLSAMTIIPASRLVVRDFGLTVRSAGHADVTMADSSSAPSASVSLFQTGCIGLLAERSFVLGGDAQVVVVSSAS